jgi:hypothetical protein
MLTLETATACQILIVILLFNQIAIFAKKLAKIGENGRK